MVSITPLLLMKALDGLSLRSEVTAANIANAGSAGYRPQRVTFEAALIEAAAQGPSAIQAVSPKIDRPIDGADEGVRLDLELATAATTTTRYSALAELLNRRLQIEALAVSGGR